MDEATSSPSAVNEFWQQKYRRDAAKSWNLFYRRNETRFFKDRHWIGREFPELYQAETKRVLEVGCGVGNFALPLSEDNPNLTIFACDFAEKAVDLFKVGHFLLVLISDG
jgi:methyltransferase-like protein 6